MLGGEDRDLGRDRDPCGRWRSFAETGTANRVQLAIAVLESGEEAPVRSMGGSRGWARGTPD
ncbi:hypothetical protein ACFQ23_12975 [Schaalia naturae]|uniref:Uncharacterized protein n=1 Tax=Schaalia naturae TaxID=635203 RepID=A0ABW2SKM1_9ACTO